MKIDDDIQIVFDSSSGEEREDEESSAVINIDIRDIFKDVNPRNSQLSDDDTTEEEEENDDMEVDEEIEIVFESLGRAMHSEHGDDSNNHSIITIDD